MLKARSNHSMDEWRPLDPGVVSALCWSFCTKVNECRPKAYSYGSNSSLRKQAGIEKTKTEANFIPYAGWLSHCPCSLVELVSNRSLFAATKLAINFDIRNNCNGNVVDVSVVYAIAIASPIAFVIGADVNADALLSLNKPFLSDWTAFLG